MREGNGHMAGEARRNILLLRKKTDDVEEGMEERIELEMTVQKGEEIERCSQVAIDVEMAFQKGE